MSIAYYEAEPDAAHWDRVWAGQTLEHLLAVARRDRLTALIERHLPDEGLALEGGCGLGQYVCYLNTAGRAIVGGDWSLEALRAHRARHADSPLVALDLTRLPFEDGAFTAYVSLGVIEHFEGGAEALLAEMHRVLAPAGVLLLSTPWVNGARRLLGRRIRARQAARHRAGLPFYQYAYTSRELTAIVSATGLIVRGVHPYSPGKGLREALALLRGSGAAPSADVASGTPSPEPLARPSRLRRLLYLPPVLHIFAHMALVVAEKP